MLVVDAGVVATAVGDDSRDGALARQRLRGHQLAAPAVVDLEVVSVLRRQTQRGAIDEARAQAAVEALRRLPMQRAPHGSLLRRCWELRAKVTPYDAAYVAVAETLRAVLLTVDERLARAPGLRCDVELMS